MGQNEGDDEQEKRVWEREIVEGNKRKKVIKEMEKKTKERRSGEMVQKLKKNSEWETWNQAHWERIK
jgi:hypothetical protein